MWPEVPRSWSPEKASQITRRHQRLCLWYLWQDIRVKESHGLAHQCYTSWRKELPMQGVWKTIWSIYYIKSAHVESHRGTSISGVKHFKRWKNIDPRYLQCDFCDAGFKEKRNLQNHISKSHPNSFVFKEENKSLEENNGNTSTNQEYEESLQLPSYNPLSMS